MLNRIYIVAGVLIILALSAAFIVPRFVQWGDYRERMQEIASDVLGTDVQILGDISFSLLPAPQLRFTNMVIGPKDAPAVAIQSVEADFSLLDFLRDRYTFTRLVLNAPVLDIALGADGALETPFVLTDSLAASSVAIASATIVDGTVRLLDRRSADTLAVTGVGGELKLTSIRGPFQFQGDLDYGDGRYAVRMSSSEVTDTAETRLSAFVRPESGAYSVSTDGVLGPGLAPDYTGTLVYRQTPPVAENADQVQGDLVFESSIEASAERVLLSSYTLTPDENRAGTRLTGAAVLRLGATRDFDAVISGGVFALAPRDAVAETGVTPFEIVRLLAELPEPPIPPIAGTVQLDISELNLRGVPLRTVRMDAATDGKSWSIGEFTARLPGETAVSLSGTLGVAENRPVFTGTATVSAQRLDALAALWRKPAEGGPLVNLPGVLTTKIGLDGDTLALSEATLELNGKTQALSATIEFGPERRLDFTGDFGALDAGDSAALAALLPEGGANSALLVTFPEGRFAVTAAAATLFDLSGTALVANGNWKGQMLQFEQLTAEDFGGLAFDVTAIAGGTVQAPRFAGSGTVSVKSGTAPALARLFDMAGAPASWRALIGRSAPAELAFELSLPNEAGGQVLAGSGSLGPTEFSLDAQLSSGLLAALTAPLAITANFSAPSSEALAAQFGLASVPLFPDNAPVRVNAVIKRTEGTLIATGITAEGGGDRIVFDGSVDLANPDRLTGEGSMELALSDASGVADVVGAPGIYVAPLAASANFAFGGDGALQLTAIEGQAGEVKFGGELFRTGGAGPMVTGSLAVGTIGVGNLVSLAAGPAALLFGADPFWPDGPLDNGSGPRPVRGEIAVTTPSILLAGQTQVTDAKFALGWDDTQVRLRELSGRLGGGTVTFDAALCCSGPLADKQVSGRLTLLGVDLDAVVPPETAALLGGMLQLNGQFSGSGDSLAAIVASLAGEGSFAVDGFSAEGFSPAVFTTLAGLDDLLEATPETLVAAAEAALATGPFETAELSGTYLLAGGTLRVPNLAAETAAAGLFGGLVVTLKDLGLAGNFALTPRNVADPDGLISDASSQVKTVLSGSLLAPVRQYDVGQMVDFILVRAYELEVDRLEALQAEDDARQLAAAQERQRLMAEQARIEAEQERIAAEQAAAEAAAELARLTEEQRIAANEEMLQRFVDAGFLRRSLEILTAPPAQRPPMPVPEVVPESEVAPTRIVPIPAPESAADPVPEPTAQVAPVPAIQSPSFQAPLTPPPAFELLPPATDAPSFTAPGQLFLPPGLVGNGQTGGQF
ncbi:MAG: hypothetical protein JWR75_141 [Devosia sp.]|nr:hypothetical protein [Devosia sp.]